MNTHTYHLDQNLRGEISKGNIDTTFLKNKYYQKEAILPVALLEYAGIKDIKKIIREINIPRSLVNENPIKLYKIKEHLENELKGKLSEDYIKERLKERQQWDNNYSKTFAQECITILPFIYNRVISHLAWDRFSQMKWSKQISDSDKYLLKDIRREICKFISQENLPVLRHCSHLFGEVCKLTPEENLPEEIITFMEIIKKVNIEHNKDIGDCEFIHTAINGQPRGSDHKLSKVVDCYTQDPVKEIKRRLILCSFFYYLLELASNTSSYDFQYKFNQKYCGRIYIIDERGNEKEKMGAKDYFPINKILQQKKKKDLETLFLLND